MAYEGWFRFGGNEVVNNERARGIANTADCPMTWLKGPRCDSLQDALGDAPYNAANLPDAPWYDLAMPDVSGRFYGVFGLSVTGLNDSTRSASVTEGIDDGATIGRTRRSARQPRVRATLLARGRDALDYGVAWLNSALDPDSCGQHGTGCGTTDLEFFTDCPPARGSVDYFSDWEVESTNYARNPSFESIVASVPVELLRNLHQNPASVVEGADGTAVPFWNAVVRAGANAVASGASVYTGAVAATPGTIVGTTVRLVSPVLLVVTVSARETLAGSFGTQPTIQSQTVTLQPGTPQDVTVGGAITGVDSTGWRLSMTGLSAMVGNLRIVRTIMVHGQSNPGGYFDGSMPPVLRRNAIVNPGPRLPTGWAGIGATSDFSQGHAVAVSTYAGDGSTSPRIQLVTAVGATPVAPGDPYYLRAEVKHSRGLPMEIRSWFMTPSGAYVVYHVSPTVSGTIDWTPVEMSGIVPAGATLMGYQVIVKSNLSSSVFGDVFEARNFTSSPGPYFDGSSTDLPRGQGARWEEGVDSSPSYTYDTDLSVSWLGAANASASVLQAARVLDVSSSMSAANLYQSSQWASSGGKSVKVAPTGASAQSYGSVGITGLTPGRSYTAIAKIRLEEAQTGSISGVWVRQLMAQSTGMFPNNVLSNQAPNEPGVHELRVSFNLAASSNLTLFLMNGSSVTPVWFDDLVIIEGDYTGEYFDGSSVPDDADLVRYSWAGAVNGSASIRETRQRLERPQTDEEYAADVEPFRRFLHDVAVTSGPLERELMNKGEFWAQTFEWTFTAGRPWVYSTTRPVELPITPTIVIQDTPYNLVPYPSAELAGGNVDAAVNYSTNPSVETNATNWAFSAEGGITTAMLAAGRVSGELQAVGGSSYRVVFTATGAGTNGAFYASQQVSLAARPAGSRVSINYWAAELLMAGTPVRPDIEFTAVWSATALGAALRTDVLGTVPVNGGPISAKSLIPPVGANFVNVRASARLTSWPAGTVLRLYADALAVTVP